MIPKPTSAVATSRASAGVVIARKQNPASAIRTAQSLAGERAAERSTIVSGRMTASPPPPATRSRARSRAAITVASRSDLTAARVVNLKDYSAQDPRLPFYPYHDRLLRDASI